VRCLERVAAVIALKCMLKYLAERIRPYEKEESPLTPTGGVTTCAGREALAGVQYSGMVADAEK